MSNIASELMSLLIDAIVQLEHYAEGRPSNWDGSTKKQAEATIKEARLAIARARMNGVKELLT